jgi:hypothetical protein
MFAIIIALGASVTAISLANQPSPTGFGITLCTSSHTVGGNACLPTNKAPGLVGLQ